VGLTHAAMATPEPAPLTVWAVSDGRAGIEAQVRGLAEAVARRRPATVEVKRVAYRAGLGRLPESLLAAPRLALAPSSAIAPPWPDIWIAAGRATLPLSRRLRRWSGGRTFVVQAQDPRGGLSDFDLVVPPLHDGVTGENVCAIVGSPNRLSAEGLAADLAKFRPRIDALPQPRVAVIVGGKSKTHDLPPDLAAQMGQDVARAVQAIGGSVLVSFTRRTPAPARAALARALSGVPGWIWDDTGDNPYFAFLAAADIILVTEDSTNLACEAATVGKPLYTLPMAGGGRKFDLLHQDLRRLGAERPFTGTLESWAYTPLDETNRAAQALLCRFDTAHSRTS
jgi:mitochondrial fission protein ELM1